MNYHQISDPELRRLAKTAFFHLHYGLSEERLAELMAATERRQRFLRRRRWTLVIAWLLAIAGILLFAYAVATGA